MTAAEQLESQVQYEGPGVGSELWGGVQANFLVTTPHHHAREIAVLLNDPALAYLAERTAAELTPAFGEGAVRHVGDLWLQKLLREGHPIPPVIVISRATLEAASPFVDTIVDQVRQ